MGKMLLPEDVFLLAVVKKPSLNMLFLESNPSPVDELLAFHQY